MSFHPPHLEDAKGRLLPKALIPLCSYQGIMLGKRHQNFTACDKFQPTVLNGQLCYSLNLSQVITSTSKSGQRNSLVIVLDQPTSFEQLGEENSLATIHLDTLAGFSDNRPGKYEMCVLKKMTGTDAFMSLPDSQKGCQHESYKDCKMEKIFAEILKECGCVPWKLAQFQKVSKSSETKISNASPPAPPFLWSHGRSLYNERFESKPKLSSQM